ncbi:hypothetical protein [Bacillus toyonensis]|uniref:hypothetical protein n=1 Tax=Bacillus toyonensis TaxID=155322 RepID=UPI0015CF1675|nr:hypothetical protein [Bacillus toyonensis]
MNQLSCESTLMGNLFSEVSCFLQSKRAISAFHCPAPAAKLFGGFASSYKAKSAFTSEAPSPSQSKQAASAFLLQK